MSESTQDTKSLRRAHNAELIRRMMKGETLTSFDSQSSWYPPRPVIEKDQDEIAKLYKTGVKKSKKPANTQTNTAKSHDNGKVVALHSAVVPLRVLNDAS